jgi:hypothetical protein
MRVVDHQHKPSPHGSSGNGLARDSHQVDRPNPSQLDWKEMGERPKRDRTLPPLQGRDPLMTYGPSFSRSECGRLTDGRMVRAALSVCIRERGQAAMRVALLTREYPPDVYGASADASGQRRYVPAGPYGYRSAGLR